MPPEIAKHWPLILSFAALAIAEVALGVPRVLAAIPRGPRTPAAVAGLLAVAFLLTGDGRAFDPYWLAIFAASTWAALAALASVPAGSPIGGVDLAVWLLLWIPFDLRWNYTLFPRGADNAYNWWALYLTIVAAIGWGRLRDLPGFDCSLVPRRRTPLAAAGAFVGLLVFCLPPALWTGFCHYPGANEPSWREAALAGPAIFLTIALPEEIFFRSILQGGLEKGLGRPWLAIGIASLAFGLMHWNNEETTHGLLKFQVEYFVLATVAGVFYGLAYRAGGFVAGALAHAAADLIWHVFFQ